MSQHHPQPPQPQQKQSPPGYTQPMSPKPDHGEESYRGSGRLAGKAAIITEADSGIGRAVAIARQQHVSWREFGENTPLGRAGQPSNEASYMTGALLAVTGGRPML